MSRYAENTETVLDHIYVEADRKFPNKLKLAVLFGRAFIWALLEIADAIRYSHE